MYVKHVSQKRFLKSAGKEVEKIQNTILDNEVLVQGRNYSSSKVQKYLYDNNEDGTVSNVLKSLLMDACIRSESLAGGSGDLCFSLSTGLYAEISKRTSFSSLKEISSMLKEKEKKWEDTVANNKTFLDRSTFRNLLKNHFKDNNEARKLISAALKVSGCDSEIVVSRTNKLNSTVKRNAGFIFNISLSDRIKNIVGVWKNNDVNIITIDGMIESVSEIHHILEESANTGDAYVIFCRSISEEVMQTILLNTARKTINVIPVEVGLDEKTLNILNDITICAQCDLVSTVTGDLITSALSKASRVERVELFDKKIIIYNDKSQSDVDKQVQYLYKKKNSIFRESMADHGSVVHQDLYDERIRALTSNKTTVEIGTQLIKKDPLVVEKIDSFFRFLNGTHHFGILKTCNLKIDDCDIIDKIFLNTLHKEKIVSSKGAIFSIKHAISFLNNVFSIGCCLLSE